jgi:hypothetical protein
VTIRHRRAFSTWRRLLGHSRALASRAAALAALEIEPESDEAQETDAGDDVSRSFYEEHEVVQDVIHQCPSL